MDDDSITYLNKGKNEGKVFTGLDLKTRENFLLLFST